jgi:hypothetical protein
MGVTGFVGVEDVSKMIEKLCLSEVNGERFILVSENKRFKSVAYKMANVFKKRVPFIEVKGIVYQLIYWFISILEFIGLTGMLTRETVKASISKNYFSNEKVHAYLNMEFEPVDFVIEQASNGYKKSPSS